MEEGVDEVDEWVAQRSRSRKKKAVAAVLGLIALYVLVGLAYTFESAAMLLFLGVFFLGGASFRAVRMGAKDLQSMGGSPAKVFGAVILGWIGSLILIAAVVFPVSTGLDAAYKKVQNPDQGYRPGAYVVEFTATDWIRPSGAPEFKVAIDAPDIERNGGTIPQEAVGNTRLWFDNDDVPNAGEVAVVRCFWSRPTNAEVCSSE